jgi:uncharacterized protein YcgI (DUF1989 family)
VSRPEEIVVNPESSPVDSDAPVQVVIPPKSGHALLLRRGQVLRVTDIEGQQVADLVAYDAEDRSEHFSQGFTRAYNDKATIAVGDQLYSNLNRPMLTVVADTVGVHDMLFVPCSRFLKEHVFGIDGETGCREHLATALEPHGITWAQVTDPFNVFMNTRIDEQGNMVIFEAPSRAGDHLDLRAERDLIIGVSACAGDMNACNAGHCTTIGLTVLEEA